MSQKLRELIDWKEAGKDKGNDGMGDQTNQSYKDNDMQVLLVIVDDVFNEIDYRGGHDDKEHKHRNHKE